MRLTNFAIARYRLMGGLLLGLSWLLVTGGLSAQTFSQNMQTGLDNTDFQFEQQVDGEAGPPVLDTSPPPTAVGGDAVRTGTIFVAGEFAESGFFFDFQGPGTIRFRWRVDGPAIDPSDFNVRGATLTWQMFDPNIGIGPGYETDFITGSVDWTEVEINVPEASRRILISYIAAVGSPLSGANAGWIDHLRWEPEGVEPPPPPPPPDPEPVLEDETPTGTGVARAFVDSPDGGADCDVTDATFVLPPEEPPTGVELPHGLFGFTVSGCNAGFSVNVSVEYPQGIGENAAYWKYDPAEGWFTIPSVVSGNTVSFTITDGGLGDFSGIPGTITDPGGIGIGTPEDDPVIPMTSCTVNGSQNAFVDIPYQGSATIAFDYGPAESEGCYFVGVNEGDLNWVPDACGDPLDFLGGNGVVAVPSNGGLLVTFPWGVLGTGPSDQTSHVVTAYDGGSLPPPVPEAAEVLCRLTLTNLPEPTEPTPPPPPVDPEDPPTAIPTLSHFGLIVLAGLFAILAWSGMRRRVS